MSELPPGHIEIHKKDHSHRLWLTPAVASVLRIYARQNNISAIDAGNRMILGFLTEHYGYESPAELRRRTLNAIFPNQRAIYDALWSIAHGEKPRRRPIPLRKDGKMPSFLTEPDSSGQDSP